MGSGHGAVGQADALLATDSFETADEDLMHRFRELIPENFAEGLRLAVVEAERNRDESANAEMTVFRRRGQTKRSPRTSSNSSPKPLLAGMGGLRRPTMT